jgi:hypothetical protein
MPCYHTIFKIKSQSETDGVRAIRLEVCWLTWFWALFFYYPMFIEANPNGFLSSVYVDNFQIGYIFLANIASLLSFVVLFLIMCTWAGR